FETVERVSEPHLDASLVHDPAPVDCDTERLHNALEMSPATSALRALERASSVDGWMSLIELSFLYELALTMPDDAHVAEVGSWKGRSTVAICEGLRARANPTLHAVDWFGGDPQVRAQTGDFSSRDVRELFEHNISDYPFVRLIADRSKSAVARVDDQSLD